MYYLTRQPKEKKTIPASRLLACSPCHDMMSVAAKVAANKKVSGVLERLHTVRNAFLKGLKGRPERQDISERVQNGKASSFTLLKWITDSKVSIQNSSQSTLTPHRRLPHKALWHHVGVTMGVTLDKNGSLYDPSGIESCDMQFRLVIYLVT